jgi:predicted SnoaL-like aldol condensation-catalyzing enzyme
MNEALSMTLAGPRLNGMKTLTLTSIGFVGLVWLLACSGTQSNASTPSEGTPQDEKQQVVALLDSIQSGDPGPVAVINPDKLIQHNLDEADGIAGFGEVLAKLPKGSARVHVVRAFADHDCVFTHTEYDFFGPKIGFDVFRFENGKIVEHWDNLQVTPSAPNPSGRSMTDGTTKLVDAGKTEKNKQLVASFLDEVIIQGHGDKLPDYMSADLLQHNPLEADGIEGLGAFLQALAEAGTPLKFDKVHHVYGEGNFVLSASEGSFKGEHSAFYDLFRVEADKIVEHWDTIQTIPPESEWKNTNGKF